VSGARTGVLYVIGLGPGDAALLTGEAQAALDACTDLFGYSAYLDRVPPRAGRQHHASDNREELARARAALALAAAGGRVGIVSGGDPGVFAMASAVFEAIETGDPAWRRLEVSVVPGVSAMFAVAARLGAPLGHDFAVVSLSDNLKPWPVILRRLEAAAKAGFVIALYNPISRPRPWQLGAALDCLRAVLPADTLVVFATAVSRPDERLEIVTLAEADPARADMRTLLLVGSAETRRVTRGEGMRDWVYTPRGMAAA